MTGRRLLRFGAEALKPHFVDGRWQRPMVSRRVAAKLRKEAIANGTFGSFDAENGGWDPAWDTLDTPKAVRPHKLHQRERDREERFTKIETAMKGMEEKIKAHKESLKALKPKPGIETTFKKVVSQAQQRR